MALSIRDSFQHRLPNLPIERQPGFYYPVSALASSTQAFDAPKGFFWRRLNVKVDSAKAHLYRLNHHHISILYKPMPSTEHTHYLQTEADVARASILELLHPVNSIASNLIPQGHGELRCLSEHYVHANCRTDIVWTYRSSPYYPPRYVAVLELKNCRSLHWQDFANAAITDQEAAPLKILQAITEVDRTFLERNATSISRQALKYNHYTGCHDVAVFDWNSMFIYDFSTMNEDGIHKTLVSGWFHTEEAHGTTFRLLLLGFLTRAMERHGILQNTA